MSTAGGGLVMLEACELLSDVLSRAGRHSELEALLSDVVPRLVGELECRAAVLLYRGVGDRGIHEVYRYSRGEDRGCEEAVEAASKMLAGLDDSTQSCDVLGSIALGGGLFAETFVLPSYGGLVFIRDCELLNSGDRVALGLVMDGLALACRACFAGTGGGGSIECRVVGCRIAGGEGTLESDGAVVDRCALWSVFDALPDFIYVLDEHQRVSFANEAFRRVFGDPNGFGEGDLPTGRCVVCGLPHGADAANATTAGDLEYTHTDGRTWLIYGVPFQYEGGVSRVLVMGIEITKRKRAEEELRRVKAYLDSVVDCMPSVLIGVDGRGLVTRWNSFAEMQTGLTAKDACGRPVGEVFPIIPKEKLKIREALESGQIQALTKQLSQQGTLRRYFDITVYPLKGIRGGEAVVRVDDVTDRAAMEELVVQSEKMTSVGSLAAGMAHEINNPLGAIIIGAQNIQRRLSPAIGANSKLAGECGTSMEAIRDYADRREIIKFAGNILEMGKKASGIVSGMLQFSRKSRFELLLTDVSEVIEAAIVLAQTDYDLRKQYDFRHIELEREIDVDLPLVPVVQTEIEQVLVNLLRNAAQAMEGNPPERRPRLIVRAMRVDGAVRIEVCDNGPGMAEDICRRVFDPFFTTKTDGTGTGLGLSVAYMIIAQHHQGALQVSSVPGEGATFTVDLPLSAGA